MALFFGYDPGGYGSQGNPERKSGVVTLRVEASGDFELVSSESEIDADSALRWFREREPAVALGMDTLLAWSFKGHRAVDDRLGHKYGADGIQQQNSLYSSMTINGILVALALARESGIALTEGHPKLLIAAEGGKLCRTATASKGRLSEAKAGELLQRADRNGRIVEQYNDLLKGADEHQADAFIAAWCASQWHFRRWAINLYHLIPDDSLFFPAGPAVYPWPEEITSGQE